MTTTPDQVVCFRSPGGGEEWRVFFNNRLCSPCWMQKGPAQAYLELLQRGERQPEYAR